MKSGSIIKELYDHFDEMSFGFKPSDNDYERMNALRNDAYQKLLASMPPDVRALYDEYEELDSSAELRMQKEIYRQGVCFGVMLMSEAFVANQNKAVVSGED